MTTVGVRISGLSKSYGSVLAVDDINLDVPAGEFVTLLGPSGCGKTTTLRSIAGLEEPDVGTIEIGDRVVFGSGGAVPVHERRLGMVFQSYAVWPHMTVTENVRFPLRMRGTTRAKQQEIVRETLERVGLAEYGHRYPGELSGGQQQRVALARALASQPAVILYDEPLSNLDAALREQMRVELRALHKSLGTTAIYVTHDQQEALVLSDRICLMNGGKVVQTGTPSEIYEAPAGTFASDFLGTSNLWEVGSVDDDAVRLRAGQLVFASGPGISADGPLDACRIAVRPHQVQLSTAEPATDDAARNRFEGIVRDATYLGDRIRYCVAVDDAFQIIAEENPARAVFRVGDRVRAAFQQEHCLLVR
jgi:ABC-type Fe3+/spermidine/putrescine transport system ATPase subunit